MTFSRLFSLSDQHYISVDTHGKVEETESPVRRKAVTVRVETS